MVYKFFKFIDSMRMIGEFILIVSHNFRIKKCSLSITAEQVDVERFGLAIVGTIQQP